VTISKRKTKSKRFILEAPVSGATKDNVTEFSLDFAEEGAAGTSSADAVINGGNSTVIGVESNPELLDAAVLEYIQRVLNLSEPSGVSNMTRTPMET
jgi:hypothetical protein